MPEPKHNKGKSKQDFTTKFMSPNKAPQHRVKPGRQDYRTPPPFLTAVRVYLGIEDFDCDLAASPENAVCPLYYTEERSAFDHPWKMNDGWNWLNPPFANISQWVWRARDERDQYGTQTCLLLPAGVSTEWFATYVHQQALVVFVRPRLTFVGCADPYPKDLMLVLYSPIVEPDYGVLEVGRVTHFASYEPENLGVDYVMMVCGVYVHITDYSSAPECPACRPAARAHRVLLARERLARLRGDHGAV